MVNMNTTKFTALLQNPNAVTQVQTKEIEGVLFRVGKSIRKSDKGRVISTVFNEDQLYNITQSDVEVR